MARGIPLTRIGVYNLGLFGNRFVRDVSPATAVEIQAGETHIMKIEHIRAELL